MGYNSIGIAAKEFESESSLTILSVQKTREQVRSVRVVKFNMAVAKKNISATAKVVRHKGFGVISGNESSNHLFLG